MLEEQLADVEDDKLGMKTIDQVDSELFIALKEYLESFASELPVRRVTVVGNAPLPPSVERRDVIDSSQLVFRCNSFVLDEPGEPPRLGTKVDVVVAARSTRINKFFFRDYPNRAYLVDAGSIRRRRIRGIPPWWPDDLAVWPIPNRMLGHRIRRLMAPETDGAGKMPTTGTLSAFVAHEVFPEAELFLTGYSFLHDRDQTEWDHQWGAPSPVADAHDIAAEGAILQSWVDDGSATFLP